MIRISDQNLSNKSLERINKAKYLNKNIFEKLSNQKKINKISDAPMDMSQIIKLDSNIKSYKQYERNINFSIGFIKNIENSLKSIQDNLIKAKEISIATANATYDSNSRKIAANEIKEIIDQIVSIANSKYNDKFVFSGFKSNTPTLTKEGDFLGDNGSIFIKLNSNNMKQINIKSKYLFEPTDKEKAQERTTMINSLKILKNGLEKNDLNLINKSMDLLDFYLEKSYYYSSIIGTRHRSLIKELNMINSKKTKNILELSNIEDIDIYKTSSDFKKSEYVLNNVLNATNKLLKPSLLDFIS